MAKTHIETKETPIDGTEPLEQRPGKFDFNAYNVMTKDEELEWRFANIGSMAFEDIIEFYEKCIEPAEQATGVEISIEDDFKEAARRLQEIEKSNEALANMVNALASENRRKEIRIEEMSLEEQKRDEQWSKEQEELPME